MGVSKKCGLFVGYSELFRSELMPNRQEGGLSGCVCGGGGVRGGGWIRRLGGGGGSVGVGGGGGTEGTKICV